jgi:transposase
MADRDTDSSDGLQRAEQVQAQSKALREQVARTAEAVAETEQEVARVHRKLAEQGGPRAAAAREHAKRAEDVAAKEHAEAERLRRDGPGEDCWPERAD